MVTGVFQECHLDPITLVAVLSTVAGGFSSAATDLIREINTEFEVQVAAAEKIGAEAEQNQRLAELTDQEARAVKQLVESVQDKASRLGSHQQWLFFLAGLLAAIPVGVLGNFAFELVKIWMATP